MRLEAGCCRCCCCCCCCCCDPRGVSVVCRSRVRVEGEGGETREERHVFVSPDSLRKALKGWGMTLDEESVFAFLKRFDVADDGRVDFTAFSVLLAEIMQPGRVRENTRPSSTERVCAAWQGVVLSCVVASVPSQSWFGLVAFSGDQASAATLAGSGAFPRRRPSLARTPRWRRSCVSTWSRCCSRWRTPKRRTASPGRPAARCRSWSGRASCDWSASTSATTSPPT